MSAIILPWDKVKGADGWIASQELTVKQDGEYRQIRRGDPIPKELFDEFQLWGLYSTRKIAPIEAKPKQPQPPPPIPSEPNDYPDATLDGMIGSCQSNRTESQTMSMNGSGVKSAATSGDHSSAKSAKTKPGRRAAT